jgi:hypothetical protein
MPMRAVEKMTRASAEDRMCDGILGVDWVEGELLAGIVVRVMVQEGAAEVRIKIAGCARTAPLTTECLDGRSSLVAFLVHA